MNVATNGETDSQAYLQFLFDVLQAMAESNGDGQVVDRLLAANIEKLDYNLAFVLRHWATEKLAEVKTDVAPSIAADIVNFSSFVQEFPLGDIASKMEIAIAGYEIALNVFTRDALPQKWATTQNNLGTAYQYRICGNKAENIEIAIAAYTEALFVRTRDAFPQQWARTEYNLGNAYLSRICGDKAENIEIAIAAYTEALLVYTREAFPQDWASTQQNLGSAYFNRIRGDKAENIEIAIAACNNGLFVRTRDAFPQDWASVQNNLGAAYFNRIRGDKAENIELAIAACNNALFVRTREAFPQDWAMTQVNLGNAYYDRISGNKAENIEIAIAAFTNALLVYTREAFPQDWASVQSNLGSAYHYRIRSNKAENIELAIAAYKEALFVRTREAIPQDWAMTQNNLGNAYSDRIHGDKAENIDLAIASLTKALEVYTREAFPQQWAMTQNNLGSAYSDRIRGDKAENIELAIAAYKEALLVYTREAFPQDSASVQNNLGNAYLKRIRSDKAENLDLAIAAFTAALSVRTRKAFPQDWAMTQNNLGNAYLKRIDSDKAENLERAIKAYTNALIVRTREAFPQDWASVQNNLGVAYSDRIRGDKAENIDLAIAAYTNALIVRTREAFPQDWAGTQKNLGNAYQYRIHGDKAQNLERAIAAYTNALFVYTRDTFPQDHAETLYNLGTVYEKAEQFTSAYTTFKSAIETVEFLRGEIVSGDETKRKQAEEWNKFYSRMVEVCLELGNITEAIEYVERSKTRNLVELILKRDLNTIFPPEVATQLEQLRDEIASGQNLLQNGKAENPKALAQYLQQLRQQSKELQDRYLPVGYGFNLDQFQANLDEQTAVIEWYITIAGFETFIITRDRLQRVNLSTSADNLTALKDWAVEYMETYYPLRGAESKELQKQWEDGITSRLSRLAEILHLQDILTLIPRNCSRLVLIPHRYLHLFPLHALPIQKLYLLDLFPNGVGYAPSCQLLQMAQKRQRPDFQSIFAIQNPTKDLLYTDLEVDSILPFFSSHQVLSESQATKDAILQAASKLEQVNYLHFSGHGFFNPDSPLDSFLLLADADVSALPSDADPKRKLKSFYGEESLELSNRLTLGNLFNPKFDLKQCRLVVLSACETGRIDIFNISDEYIGLPSGFLYAGSSSVVSSLWKVDEVSTAFLIIKFLQNLQPASGGKDISVAVALKDAQLWLRDATKKDLQEWTSKLPLNSTLQKQIRDMFKPIEAGTKPFQSPYHWAAFTAVGK